MDSTYPSSAGYYYTNPDGSPGGKVGRGSVVSRDVFIHITARVGDGVTIGSKAQIGRDVVVQTGAWIGTRVKLGEGVDIGRNAVVGSGSYLGKYVTIDARTHVGDKVRIGGFVDVKQASRIGNGTRIGSYSLIDSTAYIGCRVHIGCYCYVGTSAIVGDRVSIGNQTDISERAVVDNGTCLPKRVVVPVAATVGRFNHKCGRSLGYSWGVFEIGSTYWFRYGCESRPLTKWTPGLIKSLTEKHLVSRSARQRHEKAIATILANLGAIPKLTKTECKALRALRSNARRWAG